jgi:hypothetical protein
VTSLLHYGTEKSHFTEGSVSMTALGREEPRSRDEGEWGTEQ